MNALCAKSAVFAFLLALLATGCHRQEAVAPAPIPLDQVASFLQQTLATATQEARSQSDKYLAAIEKKEWNEALEHLKDLRANPALTQDQRNALVRVHLTTIQQLNDAADKGDDTAGAAFDHYRATK